MIYKFNKQTLSYDKINFKVVLTILSILVLLGTITGLIVLKTVNKTIFISEETRAIILREADSENEFTPIKLKEYILELNIKFPHIVMAQAELETGNFTSKIFKENSNCFGMKQARQRPTTNKGTENNHAFYSNWRESVIDYALYYAQYLSDIKTEKEYLEYLGKSYAEDPEYVNKLKKKLLK